MTLQFTAAGHHLECCVMVQSRKTGSQARPGFSIFPFMPLHKNRYGVAAGLPVASAFIVFGFQAHNSIAFLAAILTLVATLYYSGHGTNEIAKLATYIYALIEPKVEDLHWETMVAESRKREILFSPGISYPITICIFALFSIGCTFFTWWFLQDYRILNVILYSCITFILAVCFIVVSVYALHVSSTKYRSDCVARWKRLEEELYSKVAVANINNQQTNH